MWVPSLAAPSPFSPISPRLVLMDPSRNRFWCHNHTPPPDPNEEVFSTPKGSIVECLDFSNSIKNIRDDISNGNTNFINDSSTVYITPPLLSQVSQISNNSNDIFITPDSTLDKNEADFLSNNIVELRNKNSPTNSNNNNSNEERPGSMSTIQEYGEHDGNKPRARMLVKSETTHSFRNKSVPSVGVLRSKSAYEIPITKKKPDTFFQNIAQKSDNLLQNIGFLTPLAKRRNAQNPSKNNSEIGRHSTPNNKVSPTENVFKLPGSPILHSNHNSGQRAISLNSLRSSQSGAEFNHLANQKARLVA